MEKRMPTCALGVRCKTEGCYLAQIFVFETIENKGVSGLKGVNMLKQSLKLAVGVRFCIVQKGLKMAKQLFDSHLKTSHTYLYANRPPDFVSHQPN
jgi:hypothetical protein